MLNAPIAADAFAVELRQRRELGLVRRGRSSARFSGNGSPAASS
jgi:hypothetical protein